MNININNKKRILIRISIQTPGQIKAYWSDTNSLIHIYTSLRNTSKGEEFNTVRILNKPTNITKRVMSGSKTRNGIADGTNGSLNNKVANN